MATYTVTTSNWNVPAFWAAISETGPGHTLDFSALPSNFTVDFSPDGNQVIIDDGSTDFRVGDSDDIDSNNAQMGGTTQLVYFTIVVATAGDDRIDGGANGDTIDGQNGDDTLIGNDGDDSLTGNDGNDSLIGEAGNDRLFGELGDDVLEGGAGLNLLDGGVGADTLDGTGGGYDIATYQGSTGGINIDLTDTLSEAGGDAQGDSLIGIEQIDGSNFDDTISADNSGMEIYGRGGADILTGGSGNDRLAGGVGNDSLMGGAGNDIIQGEWGDDTIDGGAGSDTINVSDQAGVDLIDGGDDDDVLVFVTAEPVLLTFTTLDSGSYAYQDGGMARGDFTNIEHFYSRTGQDTLDVSNLTDAVTVTYTGPGAGTITDGVRTISFNGIETVRLSDQADSVDASASWGGVFADNIGETIEGGDGNDTLTGGNGGDRIEGGADSDLIDGGYGDDTLLGDADNDTLDGGAGDDVLLGGDGDDVVDGGDGNDTLTGGGGRDTLGGGAGDDSIDAGDQDDVVIIEDGFGNDTIDGGEGGETTGDTIDLSALNGPVTIKASNVGGEDGTITDGTDTITFTNIENFTLTDQADGIDGRQSTAGANFDLGAGNDTALGTFGADSIFGGAGDDWIDSWGSADDTIDGGTGNDTLEGGAGDDLIMGGADDDSLTGWTGNDTLQGGAGNDVLNTDVGNDLLDGGDDADTFIVDGDAAGDTIIGGEGGNDDDTIQLSPLGVGVNVTYNSTEAGTITGGSDTLGFTEVEKLELTQQNDTVDASADTGGVHVSSLDGDDSILGGAGKDTLIGGRGGDTIAGGDGDDYIDGGDGDDFLTTGLGRDTLIGGEGNDTLMNSDGDDSLVGGAGDDSIIATGGNDTLEGGSGDDTLDGGADNDRIEGGTGADRILTGTGDDFADGGDDADTFIIADDFGNDTVVGGEGGDDDDTIDLAGLSGPVTVTYTSNEAGTISDGTSTIAFSEIENIVLTGGDDSVNLDMGGTVTTVTGFAPNDLYLISGGQMRVSSNYDATSGYTFEISDDDTTWSGDSNSNATADDNSQQMTVVRDGDGNVVATGQSYLEYAKTASDGYGNDVDVFRVMIGTTTVGYVANGELVPGNSYNWAVTDINPSNEPAYSTFVDQTFDPDLDNDMVGTANADYQRGYQGDDTLQGQDGNDTLEGWEGDDVVDGGGGDDTLYGWTGNDTVSGGTGNDSILGGTGDDSLSGGTGNDTVLGQAGNDTISGGTGDDSLSGGTGDDVFIVQDGFGNDTIVGGEGGPNDDTLDLSGLSGPVTVTHSSTGAESGTITDGTDTITFSEIESLILTDQADSVDGSASHTGLGTDALGINLDARDGDDTVIGGRGGDTIDGGDGADNIQGNHGDDNLSGGAGNDTIYGDNPATDADQGHDTIDGGVGDDWIDGGMQDDTLRGGDGNDTILGGDGDDLIEGGADADTFIIEGAFGNDTIVGGELGDDEDTIDLSALSGPVIVRYIDDEAGTITNGTDTITFTQIERLILTEGNDSVEGASDTEGLDIAAGDGSDTIVGGSGGDSIDSGDGNDFIFAGDNNDTLIGGAGDDQIYGGGGDDSIDGGDNWDIIYAGDGNDTAEGGEGNDFIEGQAGDDVLDGGTGDDDVRGGDGDDTVAGGAGDDTLIGGDGNDTFVYTAGSGSDTITDFNAGVTGTLNDGDATNNDFIDLSNFYDGTWELHADQADDGVLNQSNTTGPDAVDYSNNDQFAPGEGITFSGASADSSSFTSENTGVVCFTTGTAIRTPRGDVLIDDLKVGDLVTTMDNGPQRIAWIGQRHVSHSELLQNERLHPVLIKKDVLGAARDLLVSRQHGMLLGQDHFARAVHLSKLMPGVRIAVGKRQVTYVHLMFEAHQIVFAEKIPSESFYPGPTALEMLTGASCGEMTKILPTLNKTIQLEDIVSAYGDTARVFLENQKAAGIWLRESDIPVKKKIMKWDMDLAKERYAAE